MHIQTDHHPLVPLIEGKILDYIDNSRLVSFIETAMPLTLTINQVPGRSIPGPDAGSRKPKENAEYDDENELDPYTAMRMGSAALKIVMIDSEPDQLEEGIIAAGRANLQPIAAVTWERVQDEKSIDSSIVQLLQPARPGFPEVSGDMLLPCCLTGDSETA